MFKVFLRYQLITLDKTYMTDNVMSLSVFKPLVHFFNTYFRLFRSSKIFVQAQNSRVG